MASKANRGTKRTCQNNACGERFYDLSRDPITCPMCSSPYVIAAAPQVSSHAEDRLRRAAAKKPAPVPVNPEVADAPAAEGEDALAAVAEGEEEAVATEGDETFLEEEEDEGGDVTGIIGDVAEGQEET